MKAVNVFLSLVVSAVIGLLIFEAGLRLIGKGPADRLVHFDARTGWSKKPNYEFHRKNGGYDVTIRTNELGLNDDPMPSPAKPEGVFRVLALGDSFTQGFSVERENLFVDHLERWWQSEGRPVEIVNAGTEAYDTAQEVAWLEAHGAQYEPDLVLLFPYQNDLYWNTQPAYQTPAGERAKPCYTPEGQLEDADLPEPAPDSWLSRTATGALFGSGGGSDPSAHSFEIGGRRVHREFAPLFASPPPFMADIEAHTRGALTALQRRCAELGARALVVPIPDAAIYADTDERGVNQSVTGRNLAGVDAPWSADLPVDLVLRLCAQLGIEALDARSYLASRHDAGEELYFDPQFDWHFNPAGNAAFASFLYRELDAAQAVPSAHQPGPMPPPPEAEGGVPFALKLFVLLWLLLTVLYWSHYPEEPRWQPPLEIGALLAVVFGLVIGIFRLQALLPPQVGQAFVIVVFGGILVFVGYKLGRRLGTIAELLKSFTLRGHWYLMPLVVVLLTIGSLLVVAASSPLVAPFIYTLF